MQIIFFLKNSSKEKKHNCAKEDPPILVVISLDEEKKLHLVKMTIIENIQKDHINLTIKADSIPNSDSHKILAEFKNIKHSNINASQNNKETKNILPWLKIIINNAKTFILGTYHGLPKKHLQHYLDEFCYRLNRRFCESTIFDKLIYACFIFPPVTIAASSL